MILFDYVKIPLSSLHTFGLPRDLTQKSVKHSVERSVFGLVNTKRKCFPAMWYKQRLPKNDVLDLGLKKTNLLKYC